jgi:hypothetical protein
MSVAALFDFTHVTASKPPSIVTPPIRSIVFEILYVPEAIRI